ncbi:MAG: methyltransferase domain-containing protein [bacterium]|nr:methyltransferase domain-containing protein [bacterium]
MTSEIPTPHRKTQSFVQESGKYALPPRKKDYYEIIHKILEKNGITSVLDVGTASGDFLYFMPETINGFGIDKSPDLIQIAKNTRKKKNIEFECADILSKKFDRRYECITILGTLLTFLDFRPALEACFNLNPKLIIINDFFNVDGVDIQLGFRYASNPNAPYQFAYNVISLATMKDFLEQKSAEFSFEEYKLETRLYKDEANPMYNYHAELNGETILTNGMGLILRGYNLIIIPKTA